MNPLQAIVLSFDHGFVKIGDRAAWYDGCQNQEGFCVLDAEDGGAYLSPGETFEQAIEVWLDAAAKEGFCPFTARKL